MQLLLHQEVVIVELAIIFCVPITRPLYTGGFGLDYRQVICLEETFEHGYQVGRFSGLFLIALQFYSIALGLYL